MTDTHLAQTQIIIPCEEKNNPIHVRKRRRARQKQDVWTKSVVRSSRICQLNNLVDKKCS